MLKRIVTIVISLLPEIIIGVDSVPAEAGNATLVLKAGAKAGKIKVSATGKDLKNGEMKLEAVDVSYNRKAKYDQ